MDIDSYMCFVIDYISTHHLAYGLTTEAEQFDTEWHVPKGVEKYLPSVCLRISKIARCRHGVGH